MASFAVLGDDNPAWRPDRFGYQRWGVEVGFRFPTVKLLDYAARRAELEESTNPFATVILAHLDTQETRQNQGERKDRKFRLIKRLLERGWSEGQVRRLFRVIDWMMDLPQPLADEFWNQLKQYKEEKHMPFVTTPERYGRAEGRVEGRVEGLAEGQVKGRLEGIEVALRLRFGQAGMGLLPEIRLIKDANQLERVLRSIETVVSPEELRKLWTDDSAR